MSAENIESLMLSIDWVWKRDESYSSLFSCPKTAKHIHMGIIDIQQTSAFKRSKPIAFQIRLWSGFAVIIIVAHSAFGNVAEILRKILVVGLLFMMVMGVVVFIRQTKNQ